MAGAKRKERAYALQLLYQLDISSSYNEDKIEALSPARLEEKMLQFFDHFDAKTSVIDQTRDLVKGVLANSEEIDKAIQESSNNWRIERMHHVDRNLLRLATYELMHKKNLDQKIVLDESIELAKAFGHEKSRVFVNGILDAIARKIRS